MAELLQAQADAQPTPTLSDIETLQEISTVQEPSTTTLEPYSIQPALQGVVDNSAVLQRLTELETMIKSGFDKISGKLANTMIKAAVPEQKGGARRRTRRRPTRRRRVQNKI